MTITLARIDDRLIHGQTTTRWSRAKPVQGILIVGDDVAHDDLRKKVLKAAAGNLKLGVYTIAQAPEKIKLGMESAKNFFLICNSPQVFAKLTEMGVDFGKVLNVGCMNTRDGAKVLGRTVAIDEKDYRAFELMDKAGIKLEFQLLPADEVRSWSTMKSKYDSM